jgi:hypothetical protein
MYAIAGAITVKGTTGTALYLINTVTMPRRVLRLLLAMLLFGPCSRRQVFSSNSNQEGPSSTSKIDDNRGDHSLIIIATAMTKLKL